MSALKNLPDITFVEHDTDTITNSIIDLYESVTDRKLADGDPVRLFLLAVAAIITQQRFLTDHAAKMNTLAYSTGDYLDHIGALVGCPRLPAAAAKTTLLFSLSAVRETTTTIPAGTRATAGDAVLFATDAPLVIPAGDLSGTVGATATETGSYANGYAAGELLMNVDPVPFVASIANTTTSEGGADAEDDEAYRSRIEEAAEKYSVAGSEGAYRYHAMSVSSLIADVGIDSPNPGEVVIYPLLQGGELPGQEILNAVAAKLNAKDVRPLTDYVTVAAPTAINYDIDLSYHIDFEDETSAAVIQAAVNKAVNDFAVWTKSKIGRDIDPTELYFRARQAGARHVVINSPVFIAVAENTSVAIAQNISVNFEGFENG